MDLSSHSEAQHHQVRQQNQDYASQSNDSTQIQYYDQSYYSYQQQQNSTSYQQPDCSDANQNAAHQQLPDMAMSNPRGVSALSNEVPGVQITKPGGAQQPSSYYPALNPAAAAAVMALSQLAQFAGTMDAAERAMTGLHAMVGPGPLRPSASQFPYKGGGKRGSGPFRGDVHKSIRHCSSWSGGSVPSLYGRGRGRGRGTGGPKCFLPHCELSTTSHPESSAAEEARLTNEMADSSTDAPEKATELPPESLPSVAPGKVVLSVRAPKAAWCELCRVNCTSLEILEQHKNGKRHRKNLQRIEELRKIVKPMDEVQNEQEPDSRAEVSQHHEFAQDSEENESVGNIATETNSDENKIEAENQNNTKEQSEAPVKESSGLQAGKPRMNHFYNWRHGMKRKMRGGRGGKRMKTFEGSRQPMEPPKPKVVIPLICDLCNVKCDTHEVFDCHLSGKKHIAKLKRFEGHQAMYGPIGVQALYPPNPIARTLYHPQGQHQPSFNGSEGSFAASSAYMPPQTHQAAVTSAGVDHGFLQHAMAESETPTEYGGQNTLIMDSETQQQVATVESDIKQASIAEANPNFIS